MNAYKLVHWEQPISDLRAWDRKPEVKKEYAAISESDDETAYIVTELTALRVPFEDADVVADEMTMFVCSCPHYKFRLWPDEEPERLNVGSCKHVRDVSKVQRAENDDQQETIA